MHVCLKEQYVKYTICIRDHEVTEAKHMIAVSLPMTGFYARVMLLKTSTGIVDRSVVWRNGYNLMLTSMEP